MVAPLVEPELRCYGDGNATILWTAISGVERYRDLVDADMECRPDGRHEFTALAFRESHGDVPLSAVSVVPQNLQVRTSRFGFVRETSKYPLTPFLPHARHLIRWLERALSLRVRFMRHLVCTSSPLCA